MIAVAAPWLAVSAASAASFVFDTAGDRIRWGTEHALRGDGPFLPLAVNPANAAGLGEVDVARAVADAVLQWQAASADAFTFALWHGTDPEVFVPAIREDGLSSVYFVSQDLDGMWLGAGQAGYTRAYYDGETGEIYEIDLAINDVDFALTTDPAQATFDGLLGRTLYLPDVLTHELGHALGLGHAAAPEATMFSAAWADQAALACEDVHAVRDLYDAATGAEVRGRLSGPAGPVAGMEVELVSVATRQVAAGVLTDADGVFHLPDLPDGEYVLSVSPWPAEDELVDDLYAPSAAHPCPEQAGRWFPGALDDGTVPFVVAAGEVVELGAIEVRCEAPLVPSTVAAADEASAPVQAAGPGAFAWAAVHPELDERLYYRLAGVEDHLAIDAISWSLLSPARTLLALYTADGGPVPSAVDTAIVRSYPGGADVWDARLVAEGLAPGDYLLEVRVARLPDEVFPWPGIADPAAFVLFLGEIDGALIPPDPACGPTDVGSATWEDGPPLRRDLGCGCATPAPVRGWTLSLLAAWLTVCRRGYPGYRFPIAEPGGNARSSAARSAADSRRSAAAAFSASLASLRVPGIANTCGPRARTHASAT